MKFNRPEPQDPPENVLPLINVVFLLLVFFMVAGALEKADLFEVSPPLTESGAEAVPDEGILLVSADGRIAFEGQELPAEALGAAVAEFRTRRPEGVVRLKADGAGSAAAVIEVMEVLKEAGVERLILLALEPAP